MADIRVTCPSCKTQLEIGAEFEGQEVECGTCLEVFTASAKKPKDSGTDKKSESGGGKAKGSTSKSRASRDDDDDDDRPKRRRRDEDDDDDDDDYAPRRRSSGGGNGLAITSFIPGCCCVYPGGPIALGAIITGVIGMQKQEGKGMAIAGLILGGVWIALVILLLVANVGVNMANPQQRFR